MSSKFKYVNLNNYPVYLPDSRGGQVMFRTGEGTTKQWFSRLVGRCRLTKVPISAKEDKDAKEVMSIKNTKEKVKLAGYHKVVCALLKKEGTDYGDPEKLDIVKVASVLATKIIMNHRMKNYYLDGVESLKNSCEA